MEFLNRPRTWVILAGIVAAGFLLWQFWVWEIERVEVPSGKILVKISLWGKDLPPGEIIAPNDTYKGIQQDVLREGRHFINPLFWKYEIKDLVNVPTGKCLVLTRKYGTAIDEDRRKAGDFLASQEGERGILREPLKQGNYPINPFAYDTMLVDVVEIHTGQVGVRTLKVGKDPKELPPEHERYVVPEGYRGVQEKPVPPGVYPVNPYVESIVPVDVQKVIVTFTDIEFPSTDGFTLNPPVLVKYNVKPEMAPLLLVTLTDEGKLNQGYRTQQEQEQNQILQKVVLPLIRGYVRIEGSKFEARDFLAAAGTAAEANKVNAREKLQKELKKRIPPLCEKAGVIIEEISLDNLAARGELAELKKQITDRKDAELNLQKNKSLIAQYKTDQELKANEALKEQETEKVAADILLQNAQIEAKKRKEIEEVRMKNELKGAKIRLEAAKEKARAITANGTAEADIINLENDAQVAGLRKAIQGFTSPDAYAQFQIMSKLGPALTEIFASDTSDFAKLFAGYLTGGPGKTAGAAVNTGTPPMDTARKGGQ
jgi:hypothetical protein